MEASHGGRVTEKRNGEGVQALPSTPWSRVTGPATEPSCPCRPLAERTRASCPHTVTPRFWEATRWSQTVDWSLATARWSVSSLSSPAQLIQASATQGRGPQGDSIQATFWTHHHHLILHLRTLRLKFGSPDEAKIWSRDPEVRPKDHKYS